MWTRTKLTAALLFKRLPHIALYTFSIFVLLTLGQRVLFHFLPTEYFLKYDDAVVSDGKEGQDIFFSLCRDAKGNYEFDGFRNIYLLDSEDPTKRYRVKVLPVSNTINRLDRCASFKIAKEDFRHTPGRYNLDADLKVRILDDLWILPGIVKDAHFGSNTYNIYADNETIDYESRLNDLQRQLDELRSMLVPNSPETEIIEPTVQPKPNVPSQSNPANVQESNRNTTQPEQPTLLQQITKGITDLL